MSSLKDQLAQVANDNATVAFDRKRRQKIHSASIIYNPKTAATQDYELIYENAVDAFEQLIELEPKLQVFKKTLFSKTSIMVDRNVQTKEESKQLDNAINGYLMLVSSKWHLTPVLHATEWLVRRFQIHILNSEMLMLSILNYYQNPIFKRILNIVKLKPLFHPLSPFAKSENSPTSMTMIKLFNESEFVKLYANYLSRCIKHETTYTNQLLFTTCVSINLIAFNSNNEEKLNQLIPTFLELSAKLLVSNSTDCQIAAHTIIVVLATAIPLSKDIMLAAIETILSNSNDEIAQKSAFIAICKIFQTLKGNGNVDQLPPKIYKLFGQRFSIEKIIEYLESSVVTHADKFITSYIRSMARYDHENSTPVVKLMKAISLKNYQMRFIITDFIYLSEVIEDKSSLVDVFIYLVSINEELVLNCLKSLNYQPDLFEIRLTTSLFVTKKSQTNDEDVNLSTSKLEKSINKSNEVKPYKEFLEANSQYIFTKPVSLLAEADETFIKLLSLFGEAVSKGYASGLFISSFLTTLESRITFLLKIIISPLAPTTLRLIALTNISKSLNNIDKDLNLFTLVPCLICALTDVSKNVRANVKKVLNQISQRPFTKHYFLLKDLYGVQQEVAMLSPKDSESWLKNFLNEYFIENYEFSKLLIPKKNDKMFLLFWANQALFVPLPYPKMILINAIHNSNVSNSSIATVFEPFINNYLKSRSEWELKCQESKTDFVKFETALLKIASSKEKNDFIIKFIIDAINSPHEQLANIAIDRLVLIFASLKLNAQMKIVRSITESIALSKATFDPVATLQSLPLTNDIFVEIFKEHKITPDSEIANVTKRRRRRSSNKSLLQNGEVSQIAEIYLKKLTVLLETLDKANINASNALLSILFSVLSDLETLGEDGSLPVLYAQETMASCMISAIESLKNSGIKKVSNIRADLIISTIRNTQSPQVQNKLLLVISYLTTLAPETVLHSVMPIFTFMGAHIIRQDNEFTASVIEKTLLTIIPALLQSGISNLRDEIEFLLITFSTALPHVPKHRRVRLYSTLVKTLGAQEALAPFLFFISQQYSQSVKTFKLSDAKSLVQFTKSFMSHFSVSDQLHSINHFLEDVQLLIKSRTNEDTKNEIKNRTLFSNGILNFTDAELIEFYENSINYVHKTIEDSDSDYYEANGNLKLRIYSLLLDSKSDANDVADIKLKFGSLLEGVLFFSNEVDSLIKFNKATSNQASVESEFKEQKNKLKSSLFAFLGNVLTLLPVNDFVESVRPLLSPENSSKLRYHLTLVVGSKFETESNESYYAASKIVDTFLSQVLAEENDTDVIQVTANTLSLIISKYSNKFESEIVTHALSVATTLLNYKQPEIIVSALTLSTNCIQTLGIKAIAFYPKVIPKTLSIFKELRDNRTQSLRQQQQLAILLLFSCLIKRLPSFLSSNINDLLDVIFYCDEVEVSIRLSIIDILVENMNQKDVLRVLYKKWLQDIATSEDSIVISLFLSCLEITVDSIDKKSATVQSPIFFKLLLSLFEFRSISSFDNNTISRIEASVYKVANVYVLKLNDKVFRPLFVILCNWAFQGDGINNNSITEIQRLTAFFKFYSKLQENLKGIITSYFTYLVEPTAKLLKRFISSDIADINLRRLILISLTSAFKYDKDGYWNSSARFELIGEALVDQLSNIENVIGKHLVKAIASIASSNSKVDHHNKLLHGWLVNHMKATCQSTEKLWAVKSLKLIYSKVGENWLVLLPQLVPIIAELLEDEDEDVEFEVRTGLVKVVENVLGEPFDRYLS